VQVVEQQFTFRHRNGRGRVLGQDSEVSPDSLLDRDSTVSDGSTVLHARVNYSTIRNHSRIYGAQLKGCDVSGVTIEGNRVQLLNCDLSGTDIASEEVVMASQCIMTGQISIRGSVLLDRVVASGEVWIGGETSMVPARENENIELYGLMHIHKGEWRRAPRYREIGHPFELPHMGITECVNGLAHIGCRCRPMAKWLKHGLDLRLAHRAGWHDAITRRVAEIFTEWLDVPQIYYSGTIW
jgi:uncharacterized protein YjbI with pentapeptide repeats